MRENGVDSPYLFLHPGFSIVPCRLAHTEIFFKKTKWSWTYMRETEWIRRICFFIASLVLSVARDILEKKKCLKRCGPIP